MPDSPWTKAETIGPPRIGAHYALPTWDAMMASKQPLLGLVEWLLGPARPPSIAQADPFGITAWEQGKGPLPIMMGTTKPSGTLINLADVAGKRAVVKPTGAPLDRARTLLAQIRASGFDIEDFSPDTGWILSENSVSDAWRAVGGGSRRRPPAATAKALKTFNDLGLDEDVITRLINEP